MLKHPFALLLLLLLLCTMACGTGGRAQPPLTEDSGTLSQTQNPQGSVQPSAEDTQASEQGGQREDVPAPEDAPSDSSTGEDGGRVLDPEKPMVALTYDDGPHEVYTDQLLDILEENQAAATFFEVARSLYNDADAVRRAEAIGCEVGSHSYRHADLGKMSKEDILDDIRKADAVFMDVLGHTPNLLRPPYGSVSATLGSVTGRSLITWSIDTQDWLSRDVDKILASVQNTGDLNGQVILMHSTYDTTVAASRILIPWLVEQGYQLVTVTELITQHYGDELQANGLYNYEYFRFDRPASLPAGEPVQLPAPQLPAPAEQPPAEQLPAAQPPVEQAPAEQAPAEQPPAEQPPAQQAPIEQPPAQQAPIEQPPAKQPPTKQPSEEPLPEEEIPVELFPEEDENLYLVLS